MTITNHTDRIVNKLSNMDIDELEKADNPYVVAIAHLYDARQYWRNKISTLDYTNEPAQKVREFESYRHQLQLIAESLQAFDELTAEHFKRQ